MVRLVAEVAALNADHATAKRHLMDGLTALVGASCWAWTLGYLHPDKPPVYISIQNGGFTEERFVRLLKASDHPDMKALTAPFAAELMTRRSQLTRLRQQIDPENTFPSTEAYPLWVSAGVSPLMLSARPLNEQCVSMIGLYRPADAPLFNERERQIADVVLSEVSWLHAMGWPEDLGAKAPALSRRCRMVLNLLIEGLSRKFIAAVMNISINTVAGYVKEIYAAFGVQSQAELMRRFARSNLL